MDEAKKNLIDGISLSTTFLGTSFFLYFNPDFIGLPIVARSIGVILGLIGLMGFMVELSKLNTANTNEEVKKAREDLGIGIFIAVLMLTILYFFSYWWVHLLVIVLMLLAIYAIIRGFVTLIVLYDWSNRSFLTKLPVIILNIAIFVLTILQLLQIFKVIK